MNCRQYFYRLATDQDTSFIGSLVKVILWLLSLVYAVAIWVKKVIYRLGILTTAQVKPPVICVGNMTVGGAGKTPLVKVIAEYFRSKGDKPVILSRGYKLSQAYGDANDEVLMLRKELKDIPVLVGANRHGAAKAYLYKNSADIFIMDDGFQHWKFFKDLNIVLIDSRQPFGNGYLLPRGVLREPLRELRRADIIVLTKCTPSMEAQRTLIKDKLTALKVTAPVFEITYEPVDFEDVRTANKIPLNAFKGANAAMVCSIAAPQSFRESLSNLGILAKVQFVYEDHYAYTADDIKNIDAECRKNNVNTILTTQKDAVKLKPLLSGLSASITVAALNINVSFLSNENAFFQRIDRLLRR